MRTSATRAGASKTQRLVRSESVRSESVRTVAAGEEWLEPLGEPRGVGLRELTGGKFGIIS
jgi:hypothetical protein